MQAYQYDEFEQPEWVLGQTGAVVQEMENATTDMRILLTKKFLSCIDECICQLLPMHESGHLDQI